jgi:hypothetical protein
MQQKRGLEGTDAYHIDHRYIPHTMIFIIFPGFDAPSAWHVYSPAQAWYLTALLDINL